MNERRAATLRAAVLAGGIAALAVCALAALDAMWRGRALAALFFALPWLLTATFVVAPRGINGGRPRGPRKQD